MEIVFFLIQLLTMIIQINPANATIARLTETCAYVDQDRYIVASINTFEIDNKSKWFMNLSSWNDPL